MRKTECFRARLRVAAKRSLRAGTLDAGRESIASSYERLEPTAKELEMSSYSRKCYAETLKAKDVCITIFERWGRLFFNCPAHQPKEYDPA